MVNYQTGKVYKLTSDQTDQIYIGSTCSPLSQRMALHRSDMRGHAAGTRPHVCTSFAIVQYDDAVITLIEQCPCESKEELIRRERFHIENTPNCVNRNIPGRTRAEWREANREHITAYRQVNREQIAAKAAAKVACECGATIGTSVAARHLRSAKHMRFVAAAEPEWADLLD